MYKQSSFVIIEMMMLLLLLLLLVAFWKVFFLFQPQNYASDHNARKVFIIYVLTHVKLHSHLLVCNNSSNVIIVFLVALFGFQNYSVVLFSLYVGLEFSFLLQLVGYCSGWSFCIVLVIQCFFVNEISQNLIFEHVGGLQWFLLIQLSSQSNFLVCFGDYILNFCYRD